MTLPAPVLRRKARKVTTFGPELQTLIDDMVETMRAAPGVGLAAPQVDVPSKVIVVEFGHEEDENIPKKLYTLVNPEIVRQSDEKVTAAEACLSIPGFAGEVERHETIHIKALNRKGKPVRIKADGWLARIFQHEIDHLEGKLYIDRAQRVWKMEEADEQIAAAD
jgi:peptide deformylase